MSLSKKLERIGESRIMNCGMKATIIAYRNTEDIDVQFEDGYIAKNKKYISFKNNNIANPYIPTIYNIGYIGETSTVDKKGDRLKSYKTWREMIRRCYDEETLKRKPTYQNCKVCEEWHCYANFKKWYNDNIYEIEGEIVELDKDILIKNNKIYSPEACIFVPKEINLMFSGCSKKSNLPAGVYYVKTRKKYQGYATIDGKHKTLGYFNTPEEAHISYLKFKNTQIFNKAEKYKNLIPSKLYNRLLEIATSKTN